MPDVAQVFLVDRLVVESLGRRFLGLGVDNGAIEQQVLVRQSDTQAIRLHEAKDGLDLTCPLACHGATLL